MELHVISTGRQSFEEWLRVSVTIHPFVSYLHIRERDWTYNRKVQALEGLLTHGVPRHKIIFNDEPGLAMQYGLGGVHFPERSTLLPDRERKWRFGVSVHDVDRAIYQQHSGVDYMFYGHIYETTSKPGIRPRGLNGLREVTKAVTCPVIAIGGITPERSLDCLKAGARGVAVMSGVYEVDDPVARVKEYENALRMEDDHV